MPVPAEAGCKPTVLSRFTATRTNLACFARAVRAHWGIENGLHWGLDVAFREDDARIRQPQAREHFAVLRHLALSRLKNDAQSKLGIKNKRLKAGWDERYLARLLFDPNARASASSFANIRDV